MLDIETTRISGINTLKPGYICEEDDVVVGLQSDKPLKRLVNPYGGMRMVQKSLACYQRKLNPTIEKHFTEYRKTHNDGVFDAYTPAIRAREKRGAADRACRIITAGDALLETTEELRFTERTF